MQTPHQPPSATAQSAATSPLAIEPVPLREQLSALVDDECDMVDWATLHAGYTESAELKHAWADYHLIGEVLRSQAPVPRTNSAAFVAGVMAKVAQETQRPVAEPVQPVVESTPLAANDDVFRWKTVAGFASFAAVASVVWQLVATPALPSGPQLASAPTPSDSLQLVVTPAGNVMIRDAQLDELMAAHRQWGGVSALQMPAGFLRSATYEPSQR